MSLHDAYRHGKTEKLSASLTARPLGLKCLRHHGTPLSTSFVARKYSPAALLTLSLTLLLSLSTAHSAPSHPPAPEGQEVGTPVLQAHTYKEYNSDQQVWTITQDRRGFIYIGVTGGTIVEYDGATWRHIFTSMSVIRSLTTDDSGRIWVTGGANFGYLAPDAVGALHFVSLLDRVSPQDRHFTNVWKALPTPQGVFFRAYEMLFRWDGFIGHSDGVASIRWDGQKWIDEVGSTDWLLSFVVPSCTRHDSHPEDLKHCAHKIRRVSIQRSL